MIFILQYISTLYSQFMIEPILPFHRKLGVVHGHIQHFLAPKEIWHVFQEE